MRALLSLVSCASLSCCFGFEFAQAAEQCQFDPLKSAYTVQPPTKGWTDIAKHYDLFFGSQQFTLSTTAVQLADEAAAFALLGQNKVVVWGYTDTVGTVQSDEQLSYCRAVAVADELVRRGVNKVNIRIWGAGKSEFYQAAKTPDQTLEPRNNRASIDIE